MRIRLVATGGTAVVSCIALSTAAHAVCMAQNSTVSVGLPSISATEVSTAQAVEMVRRRQQQEQAGLILASAAAVPSVAAAAQPAPGATSGSAPASKSQPKAKAASAPAKTDDAAVARFGSSSQTRGIWAQGYADYERRTDLTIDTGRPGDIDRNEVTGGFVAGTDWTYRLDPSGSTGVILGLFGGYNATHGKESVGVFRESVGGGTENFRRSDAEQDVTGGFLGGYAAYFRDRFALQGIFKTDLYGVEQSDTLLPLLDNGAPCGDPAVGRRGEADLINYIIEANASYRYDLRPDSWLEPVAGFRFTYSDYSGQSGDLRVGADGNAFRVQGGLRYGNLWRTPQGLLTTTLTGLLYSDVAISGFENAPGAFTPATSITDEGKLRVMGQFAARLDQGNGYSYLFQVETRGGEDLFGVGGRIGGRYEW